MTNATNPTAQSVSILGGLIVLPVDQTGSIRNQFNSTLTIANGTVWKTFNNPTTGAANYSVPAATNLRIWGYDASVFTKVAADTLTALEFGYADDSSGTNYVRLFNDWASLFASAASPSSTTTNNFITGLLTVPATKLPIMKSVETGSSSSSTYQLKFFGLETN